MDTNQPNANQSIFTPKTILLIFLFFVFALIIVANIALYLARQNKLNTTTAPFVNETGQEGNPQEVANQQQEVEYVPNLESTNDWLTYSNSKFNYSFKYPPNVETFARNPENGDEIPISETSEIVVFVDPSAASQNHFFVVHFMSAESSSSADLSEEVIIGENVRAFKDTYENPYIDLYGIPVTNPSGRLEVYVSKNESLRDRANTILSTFAIE